MRLAGIGSWNLAVHALHELRPCNWGKKGPSPQPSPIGMGEGELRSASQAIGASVMGGCSSVRRDFGVVTAKRKPSPIGMGEGELGSARQSLVIALVGD